MADQWWSKDQVIEDTPSDQWWSKDQVIEEPTGLSKLWNALKYGANQVVQGYENTYETGLKDSTAADSVAGPAKAFTQPDEGYVPASEGFSKAKGFLDKAGYVPRMLLEGAPGVAIDTAAALVPGVGLPLATASVLARQGGNDVLAATRARTGNPNTKAEDVQQSDSTKALLAGAVDGLLTKFGIGKALNPTDLATKSAGPIAAMVLNKAIKSGVVNAGMNVLSEGSRDLITQGSLPTGNDILQGILTGAAGGALGSTIGSGRSIIDNPGFTKAKRFPDITDAEGRAFLDVVRSTGVETPFSKENYKNTIKTIEDTLPKLDTKANLLQARSVVNNEPLTRETTASLGNPNDPTVILSTLNKLKQNGVQTQFPILNRVPLGHYATTNWLLGNAHSMVRGAESSRKLQQFEKIFGSGDSELPTLKTKQDVRRENSWASKAKEAEAKRKSSNEPKGSQEDLIITEGDHTVRASRANIKNPSAFEASVRKRLVDRNGVMKVAKGSSDPSVHKLIDEIHYGINHNAVGMDSGAAKKYVKSIVMQAPGEHYKALWEALDNPKLWASFSGSRK